MPQKHALCLFLCFFRLCPCLCSFFPRIQISQTSLNPTSLPKKPPLTYPAKAMISYTSEPPNISSTLPSVKNWVSTCPVLPPNIDLGRTYSFLLWAVGSEGDLLTRCPGSELNVPTMNLPWVPQEFPASTFTPTSVFHFLSSPALTSESQISLLALPCLLPPFNKHHKFSDKNVLRDQLWCSSE